MPGKSLLPTRNQWKKWSLPSRLTALGALLGLVSILLGIATLIPPMLGGHTPSSPPQQATDGLESVGELVRVVNARRRGPIDAVKTTSDEWLPFAKIDPDTAGPGLAKGAHIGPAHCFFVADLVSSVDRATVEEVVVRVTGFEDPPSIADTKLVAPAMTAHFAYVSIDSPEKAGTAIFRRQILHESPLDYLALVRDEMERVYVLVNARTPGVYEFEVGLVVQTEDNAETLWIASAKVYFYAEEESSPTVSGQEALRLLETAEPAFEQISWIQAVAKDKTPGAFEVLESALMTTRYRNNPQVLEEVCVALGQLDGKRAFALLTSRLEAQGQGQVLEPDCVAEGLAASGSAQATALLLSWLEGEDPELRSAAVGAFVDRHPPEARPLLIDRLLNDPDGYTRYRAARSLKGSADPATLPALRRALEEDADDSVRQEAALALAAAGDREAGPAIVRAMAQADWIDEDYLRALVQLQETRAVCALVQRLRTARLYEAGALIPALTALTGEHFGFINSTTPDVVEDKLNDRVAMRWLAWWDGDGSRRFGEDCQASSGDVR